MTRNTKDALMQRENAPEPTLAALEPGGRFRFACHPRVACFNACCRDLNQFLTPYDILRMKRALGMDSSGFLATWTERHTGPQTGLPVATIKPADHQTRICPFVTPEGCRIYHDRPGSCRTYPLVRMAARNRETGAMREEYYLIMEPHCTGFGQDKEWTVDQWVENQELAPYNEANDLFMRVIAAKNRLPGPLSLAGQLLFETACYDLDRFRERAAAGDLQGLDAVPADTLDAALASDEALSRFAHRWLLHTLFSEPASIFSEL